MPFRFFEEFRWANAHWYTANPLGQLSDDDLAALAEQSGMSIEELRQWMTIPHLEMSCPLCGQAQTHLVNCTGCGGDAWGAEFEECYGDLDADPGAGHVKNMLRQRFREALKSLEGTTPEQIAAASNQAYAWGGCMICSTCWHHLLPVQAFESCPLHVFSERVLRPSYPPQALLEAVMLESPEERKQAVQRWLGSTWANWVEHWNTESGETHEAIGRWRARILQAALLTPNKEGE